MDWALRLLQACLLHSKESKLKHERSTHSYFVAFAKRHNDNFWRKMAQRQKVGSSCEGVKTGRKSESCRPFDCKQCAAHFVPGKPPSPSAAPELLMAQRPSQGCWLPTVFRPSALGPGTPRHLSRTPQHLCLVYFTPEPDQLSVITLRLEARAPGCQTQPPRTLPTPSAGCGGQTCPALSRSSRPWRPYKTNPDDLHLINAPQCNLPPPMLFLHFLKPDSAAHHYDALILSEDMSNTLFPIQVLLHCVNICGTLHRALLQIGSRTICSDSSHLCKQFAIVSIETLNSCSYSLKDRKKMPGRT